MGKFDLDQYIRSTVTWAETIVKEDPEWKDYSGIGPYGRELASIDVALKYVIQDDPILRIFLKLRRAHIMQLRKSHFAGVLANQITMLAFIKGAKQNEFNAFSWRNKEKPKP